MHQKCSSSIGLCAKWNILGIASNFWEVYGKFAFSIRVECLPRILFVFFAGENRINLQWWDFQEQDKTPSTEKEEQHKNILDICGRWLEERRRFRKQQQQNLSEFIQFAIRTIMMIIFSISGLIRDYNNNNNNYDKVCLSVPYQIHIIPLYFILIVLE